MGRSFFESEIKRCDYFFGQEFAPTTKVHTLADKTKIEYWYKAPADMLVRYAQNILSMENVQDLECVDYTVGGDHGKGRFRMILKVILRYSDNKPPFYKLFLIACVDYSEDGIDVLCHTV